MARILAALIALVMAALIAFSVIGTQERPATHRAHQEASPRLKGPS
ncbi:MAG: hypothetical protein JF595_01720 [Sphingomonadales bacterium]|nr:hypothetical protein [Sphingomonadales bacterium]